MLIGACQRGPDGTSTNVRLLRVPLANVPADRVVANGYSFYEDTDPTLLSGLLSELGFPALRPPSLNEFFGRASPADVCGSSGKSSPDWVLGRLRLCSPPK